MEYIFKNIMYRGTKHMFYVNYSISFFLSPCSWIDYPTSISQRLILFDFFIYNSWCSYAHHDWSPNLLNTLHIEGRTWMQRQRILCQDRQATTLSAYYSNFSREEDEHITGH
jgi:hypothetical protein